MILKIENNKINLYEGHKLIKADIHPIEAGNYVFEKKANVSDDFLLNLLQLQLSYTYGVKK